MIRIEGMLLEALERLRIHPREIYEDLLETFFEQMQTAGGKAGMDMDRFLDMLSEGKLGPDAQRELLAST